MPNRWQTMLSRSRTARLVPMNKAMRRMAVSLGVAVMKELRDRARKKKRGAGAHFQGLAAETAVKPCLKKPA
jgi:hypothetical protein